ncbi:MAG: FtsX-like permease family protein [Planctomycetes bacterium]|nr:FtsX-like permease family protein [Planctomycetota bacterium]
MNIFGFIVRSIVYYRRRNVGLFLTAVVSAAVLAGALLVGDSVRYSLARIVDLRLGATDVALVSQKRFFTVALADRISEKLDADVAPVMQLVGMVSNSDSTERLNQAQVLGVNGRFFDIGSAADPFAERKEGIVVNQQAAARLGVKAGDEILLRIGKPGQMSRDVGLVPDTDLTVVYRGQVIKVIDDEGFGRFSLRGDQVAPFNIFVPLNWLAKKIDKDGLCNTLLVAGKGLSTKKADAALTEVISLNDVGLETKAVAGSDEIHIKSRRVFIDEFLSEDLLGIKGAKGHLTYFVNEIRSGEKATPYSMVTATEMAGIAEDEIVINQWLAEDIAANVGDTVELAYYVMADMRKLIVHNSKFTVKGIVAVDRGFGERELMPDFPGLSDAENCRDWDPGMPVDLDKIRDKDEAYWDKYRGTPKAFITLAAGQKIWANRFGNLTGARYQGQPNLQRITEELTARIDPSKAGFAFIDVRQAGQKGVSQATDFGQLFMGLSMFLIAAAMILTSLVFGFSIDKRSAEIGMLKAVGFTAGTVRRMFLLEASGVAFTGCIFGAALGVLYTKAMILGLSTVWSGAVSATFVYFYGNFSTVCIGALCGFSVSMFSVWLSLRKHLRKEARELLNMGAEDISSLVKGGAGKSLWVSAAAFAGAAAIILRFSGSGGSGQAGAFFCAGALLLVAGISLVRLVLKGASVSRVGSLGTLAGFAWRNASRRSGRSLAVVSLIAAGSFLVVSIGVFRHDPLAHAAERDSGTGGFALFGQSSIPVVGDLNDLKGRKKIDLLDKKFDPVRIVQMRVRDGDDASCLNLNRAQTPQVIGVDPVKFQTRAAFGKVKMIKDPVAGDVWQLLEVDGAAGVVNAVADNATVIWALGKKLGDTIDFVDSKGHKFKIRIAGIMGNSILQGSLIISEKNFVTRFALEDGYRMFLVDTPPELSGEVSEKLAASLVDFGIDVSTTAGRLGRFSEVENTYLSIFQLLGGLSLILASVGLGMVVLVNVLDRRGELAMLRAVGFTRKTLTNAIFIEHFALMSLGLICGVGAAIIAVLPALTTPGRQLGFGILAIIIALLTVFGILFIWLSAFAALRGELIDALRKE